MIEITAEFLKQVQEKATLLISYEQLSQALDRMAQEMELKLSDKMPIFLTIMNGGLMFTAELAKRLNFPVQMDYLQATRYMGELSGGNVQWKKEPNVNLNDRVVVILDDILDGGLTLTAVYDYCHANGAKEIYSAVMLDKPAERDAHAIQSADFTGMVIPNEFVFGFGLDYYEYLRNVPGIYAVAPEHKI